MARSWLTGKPHRLIADWSILLINDSGTGIDLTMKRTLTTGLGERGSWSLLS